MKNKIFLLITLFLCFTACNNEDIFYSERKAPPRVNYIYPGNHERSIPLNKGLVISFDR